MCVCVNTPFKYSIAYVSGYDFLLKKFILGSTMNLLLSLFLGILLFSMISVQLTSSASFPNPPQFPPPNASADEWSLFLRLLHNYYAIIARPR
jgi:hypothetical protein